MRWGVRDEMTNEHMTTSLCMNELRGCQKYSMGPNFIYFGGQKYGYRPIPSEIDTEELTKLIEVLKTMGNDTSLLEKWYRKDNNKVPPESILLPITTHLPHFLNKRMPKLQVKYKNEIILKYIIALIFLPYMILFFSLICNFKVI